MRREFRNDQECLIFDSKAEIADYWERRKHEFNAEGQKIIDVIVAFFRLEAAAEALK